MRPKLMDWEGERVSKIDAIWMLACITKSLKNRWFWRPKSQKIVKKTIQKINYIFFACDFQSILERFGEGFGRVLGKVWRVLVALGPLFCAFFWCLYSECSLTGILEATGLDFGSIFKGLGRVWGGFWVGFGRVLGGFGGSKIAVFLDCVF